MSIEQKLYVQGVEQKSLFVNPGEVVIMPLRLTSGIENAQPNVEYILDVITHCRDEDDFGTVKFTNPINERVQTHLLINDLTLNLGIRLDDGREGHMVWSHSPKK